MKILAKMKMTQIKMKVMNQKMDIKEIGAEINFRPTEMVVLTAVNGAIGQINVLTKEKNIIIEI
jgi:hypothetical protein